MLKFIKKMLFGIKLPKIQVRFSPNGGCTENIIQLIKNAKKKIYVQAYVFTQKLICDALIEAKNRNVDVQFIGDGAGMSIRGSMIDPLSKSGIQCFTDNKHQISHNKIILIDRNIVITGSFNFSANAESKNAENLVIINDRKIASEYLDNWNNHKLHSKVYEKKLTASNDESLF